MAQIVIDYIAADVTARQAMEIATAAIARGLHAGLDGTTPHDLKILRERALLIHPTRITVTGSDVRIDITQPPQIVPCEE